MCGIAAIYSKSSSHNAMDLGTMKHALIDMMRSMKHRGPDGEGLYLNHRACLGMVRLTIVGGESGNQPIWNEDKTVVLVCNGEIYNHQALRAQLERDGHVLNTKSDVEVIVHLYEQFGLKFLNHLEGIFAFALWDLKQDRLILARDRVGVKPLYYTETGNYIVFASELKALLTLPKVNLNFNEDGFSAYHCFRFAPMSTTVLEGVKKVQPGEYIVVSNNRLTKNFYWSAAMVPEKKLPKGKLAKQRVRELRDALIDAVEIQFASEVKSGVLLSGGVDSSALLAISRQIHDRELSAVTISFEQPYAETPEAEYNEIGHAQRVAREYGVPHFHAEYDAREVFNQLPTIIASLDEPVADPTAIPLWFATRLAKEAGLKVVYSGEGLDELFNGYEIYRQIYWLKAAGLIPRQLRQLAHLLARRTSLPGRGLLLRSLNSPSKWYQGVGSVYSIGELKNVLDDGYLRSHSIFNPQTLVERMLESVAGDTLLAQMTYFDITAWLPENTLVKSDKISMSNSVELRVPFLHRPIVDLALRMHDKEKLRFNCGKWIVKKALVGMVPQFVLERKKAGFPIPLSAWMFHEWADDAKSILLDPNACTRGIYNPRYVEQMFKPEEKSRRRAARQLWTLLCFELWYRQVYLAAASASDSRRSKNRSRQTKLTASSQ